MKSGMSPGEMMRLIRAGDRIKFLVYAGFGRNGPEYKPATGRAVMPSADGGWVVDMGGKYGTPGVVTTQNIVAVL